VTGAKKRENGVRREVLERGRGRSRNFG